ncbi:MAG TPA: DUF402 domain-containing protein [Candidatus Corynebacterium gallistercoris]|uniref:DUF402 domain-containing protein n=1 Tax=Candidatus Corynebacterium gallistercoris TaxID=2838530 RepID=A0A9D1RZZ1_9CORY|nr:DUF402 domain-containing protein [Candidatus Corynebacterium gallistercoris]
MADLHPVKEETFNLHDRTNIDPKGITREVDEYSLRETPKGPVLYMARPTPGHPRFHYLESWLIPHLDARVNIFHFFEGESPTQDLYIDVAIIDPGKIQHSGESSHPTWRTRDIYIDVVTHDGSRVQVLDLDELGEALEAGLLSPAEANRGLHAAQRIMDGIYLHGSARMWLEQEGVTIRSERG